MQLLMNCAFAMIAWASYTLCVILYRLCFHPLSHFPGPKLAAATKWYEFWFDLIRPPGGTFMYEIERMHKVYGPIIRVNPEELHVKDSDWLGTLYTGPASGLRDKYPPAAHMTGTPDGIFGTISHEVHRKRRAAVSPFFSKNTVASSEHMIYEKVDLLSQMLRKKVAKDEVVELRQTYLALTTDTLCSHAFDISLNLLTDDQAATEWKRTIKAVTILTPLIKQFTWIIPLALKVPLTLLQFVVPDLARIVVLRRNLFSQAKAAVCEAPEVSPTKATIPLSSSNIFKSILANKNLSQKEKMPDRITQEGFVVLVAGGETTARVLTTATYHLLANKDTALLPLKVELAGAMEHHDTEVHVKDLEQLPWLTAVIKESLRITALVTSRLPLVSPEEVLKYGDWEVPAGTPISMTLRDILLDPTIFVNPLDFKPERWLPSNPDLQRINQAYVPFGRGSRMCLGLNFALAELYIVIASLFRRFDLQLVDTVRERDVDAVRDCFIGEPSPKSLGVRVKILEVIGEKNSV